MNNKISKPDQFDIGRIIHHFAYTTNSDLKTLKLFFAKHYKSIDYSETEVR